MIQSRLCATTTTRQSKIRASEFGCFRLEDHRSMRGPGVEMTANHDREACRWRAYWTGISSELAGLGWLGCLGPGAWAGKTWQPTRAGRCQKRLGGPIREQSQRGARIGGCRVDAINHGWRCVVCCRPPHQHRPRQRTEPQDDGRRANQTRASNAGHLHAPAPAKPGEAGRRATCDNNNKQPPLLSSRASAHLFSCLQDPSPNSQAREAGVGIGTVHHTCKIQQEQTPFKSVLALAIALPAYSPLGLATEIRRTAASRTTPGTAVASRRAVHCESEDRCRRLSPSLSPPQQAGRPPPPFKV